jgi:hypothetical protein
MDAMKETSLGESWFGKVAEAPPSSRVSDPPSLPGVRVAPKAKGRLGFALAFGVIGGGGGAVAMLLVAEELVRRFGMKADVVATFGRGAMGLADPRKGGFAIAIACGVLVGVLFGALMRYSLRVVSRLLAGALLAPVLWTLVHAFVFTSFAPTTLGALPFGPLVAGAAVYGLCVAILPPPREKRRFADDDD